MIYAQRPIRTVAPAATPVSLTEAKSHLRVDHSDEDTYIGTLVDAATARVDGYAGVLGRCLVTQTWQQKFDELPTDGVLELPFPDVSSVTVVYDDDNGDEQTLSSALYHLVSGPVTSEIRRDADSTWPTTDNVPGAVRVTMVCGYGDAAAVPPTIKAAILLIVGDLYRNREGASSSSYQINQTLDALLAPYRMVKI